MTDDRQYWAFISYSNHDRKWAEWLGRALERYPIPKAMRGSSSGEERPSRFFPVFRDRDELPATADLSGALIRALELSRYLIIVCSPHSAVSKWVNEEVRQFKSLGRDDRILCMIVDGEPFASERPDSGQLEAFAPALRFRVDANGLLTHERAEPIAADARSSGDGKSNAKLKLLAGMLGTGFDDLKQRDARRRRKRVFQLGLAGLLLIAVITLSFAYQQGTAHSRFLSAKAIDTLPNDRVEGLLLAIEATRRRPTFEAQDALRQAMLLSFPRVRVKTYGYVVFNPDGTKMFNSRELIDTSTGEVLWHTQDHIRQTGVFSPDGSQVASAGYLDDYKAIQLYDANTGEHIRKLEGHRNWFQRCDGKQRELKKERDTVVQFLTYTGDGRILISAGDDGQIIGWDTETGRELYVYKAPCGRILELHLSPEGGVLAARHDGGIVLLDARTGGILFQKQGYIRRMAYDRTGGRLVVNWGTEDPRTEEPSIWRISYYSQSKEGGGTEKEKKINVTSSKLNLGQLVSKVLFSPDGEFLIGSKGHELRMWDTRTGKLISTLWSGTNTKNHIKDICFSPDGQKLAVNFEDFNDGVILILQFPVPYSGPISRPALITLSTDQSIISYGFTTNNELYVYGPPASGEDTWASLWPVRNAAEVCSMIRHRGGQINDIAFSPNQDKIVTAASDKTASLWGLDNGTMLLNFEKHQSDVYAAVFSPDGKRIVTASRDLSARVFKTETGEEQAVIQFKPPENVSVTCFVNCPRHFGVRTVSFSPDGSRILAAASHGTLAVLSLNEEHPVFLQADWQIPDDVSVSEYADAKSGTYGAAFLPDGQRFISAGMSGAIHLWAFDSQSAISKIPIQPERFPRPAIEHLFLGPKGKRALVLTDSGVIGAEQLVNLETSERVVFYGGHNAATMTAAMDPLGTSVATVDTVGTVCIWSTETGKLLRRLVGHRNAIRDVEYSPDGKLLLTASHDGTARLWDVRTGAPVAVLRGHNGAVRRAVFSIDGRQIASAGKGSKAVVYLTHLGDLLKAAETKLPTPRNEEIERRLIKSKRVSWVLFGR